VRTRSYQRTRERKTFIDPQHAHGGNWSERRLPWRRPASRMPSRSCRNTLPTESSDGRLGTMAQAAANL